MAREVKNDFEKLCAYIEKYSLSELLGDKEYINTISSVHKKYYSLLTLVAELQSKVGDVLNDDQYNYIQESCSDVGQSMFLIINGCYKGANLLLRSSIENFLKGFCLDQVSDITNTKSVYEVFDKAKQTAFFSATENEKLFSPLRDKYAFLCQTVHTSTVEQMASITALKQLPSFDKNEATLISNNVILLSQLYLTCLALKYNQVYLNIPYQNLDIIKESLIKDYRKRVNNID